MRATYISMGAIAAAIALAGGCHKEPLDDKVVHTAPPGVMLTVSFAMPQFDGVRDALNAIRPGTGTMLGLVAGQLPSLVGAASLTGLDLDGPTDVIVVDDAPQDGNAHGVAIVGKVKNEKDLMDAVGAAKVQVRDGWAIVGPTAVVDEITPWALSTLRAAPRTPTPIARAHVGNVLRRFHDQIAAGRAQMHAQMAAANATGADFIDAYFDGLQALAGDSDEADLTFTADASTINLDFALVPKPTSRFAQLVADQQPSTFALLDKLPVADTVTAAVAGHFVAGPYRAGLLELGQKMINASDLVTAYDALLKASTGEVALSWNMTTVAGLTMNYVFGVESNAAATAAIAQLMTAFGSGKTMDMMGIKMTYAATPDAGEHDGVKLSGYQMKVDVSGAPPSVQASQLRFSPTGTTLSDFGVFDNLGVIVTAADASAASARAIDAARGKAPHFTPNAETAQLLDGARAHKDSLAAVVDLAQLRALATGVTPPDGTSSPALISIGFADHAAHLRAALPIASLKPFLPH